MNVNTAYSVWIYALQKNLQQGYASPADFNLCINQASRGYQSWLGGESEQYQQGRPYSRVSFGQNENVRQSLAPTIYGYNLHVDVNGFAPYPSDFEKVDALWSIYGNNRIRYASQDRFYSIYNSKIDPYATNPFYLIEDLGFRFFPQSILTTHLSYVKNVPQIVWGYTPDVNGIPVYNPATSIDPVWADLDMMEVIARALRLAGVNLQAAVVSQYATEIKQGGQ